MRQERIGIVIPWFGKDQTGGAEQQALNLAHTLQSADQYQIEVLTTCSGSFISPWEETKHPAGTTTVDGLRIHRFPVYPRRGKRFNKVVTKLLRIPTHELFAGVYPLSHQDESIYWQENIRSPQMVSFLKQHASEFKLFIFMPYLFGIIQEGIHTVADKALLVPCLHHESYAYLNATRSMFAQARYIGFNSEGERQLAVQIYGRWIYQKSKVLGEGIEIDWNTQKATSTLQRRLEYSWQAHSFFLSLGRQCFEKNTHLTIEAYIHFAMQHPHAPYLIVAGASDPDFIAQRKTHPKIIYLGFVDNAERSTLLQHCCALIVASTNESFSRVMYEAWAVRKPILAHQACLATACAVHAGKHAKGLTFDGQDGLQQALHDFLHLSTSEKELMGRHGFEYAKKLANWDQVKQSYLDTFAIFPTLPTWKFPLASLASINRDTDHPPKRYLRRKIFHERIQVFLIKTASTHIEIHPSQNLQIHHMELTTSNLDTFTWHADVIVICEPVLQEQEKNLLYILGQSQIPLLKVAAIQHPTNNCFVQEVTTSELYATILKICSTLEAKESWLQQQNTRLGQAHLAQYAPQPTHTKSHPQQSVELSHVTR
ncbi:MAG: glycosyltransferase family 4 protein [Zetaproteobacteria bacterium]|nr:glycosyltransferase family 4 protein [Zetaproteobacteria bacterium]